MEEWIKQILEFYQGNKEVTAVIVGVIAGWILTQILPGVKSSAIDLLKGIRKRCGGRLAYKGMRDSYLNWVVYQNQDLNLTGVLGNEKPKLEQIFTSLRVVGENDISKNADYLMGLKSWKRTCFRLLCDIDYNYHFFKNKLDEKIDHNREEGKIFKPHRLWRVYLLMEQEEPQVASFIILGIIVFGLFPINSLLFSKDINTLEAFISAILLASLIIAIFSIAKDDFEISSIADCAILAFGSIMISFLMYIIYTKVILDGQSGLAIYGGIGLSASFFLAEYLYNKLENRGNLKRERSTEEMGGLLSSEDNIAILGKPGSGKSTYTQFLALTFAQEKAGDRNLRKKGIVKARFNIDKWYLPLMIPLRDISEFLISNEGKSENLIIEAFRKDVLPSEISTDFPTSFILHMLQKKQCLFLLDGLDEVSDSVQFQATIKEIRGLVSRFPGNKFILTSRYAGWRGGTGSNFKIFEIKDLDDNQIEKFIDSWYNAVEYNRNLILGDGKSYSDNSISKNKAKDLKSALKNVKNIRTLAENPLLLSIICFVHYNKILPQERLKLYSDCSDLLLDQWDKEKGFLVDDTNLTIYHKNAIMQEIAFAMHSGKIGANYGRKEATSDEIIPIVKRMLNNFQMDETQASQLFQKLIDRSGIMVTVERYSNRYSFSHLTFQEYYTAKYIHESRSDIFDYGVGDLNGIDGGWWQEVLLLYCKMQKNPSKIIDKLCGENKNEIINQRLRLAAQCLSESVEKPRKEIEYSVLNKLYSIRINRPSSELISIAPAFKRYLLNFALKIDFYDCSIADAVSNLNSEKDAKILKDYLLTLSNSSNRDIRLIAVNALNKLNKKYHMLNETDLIKLTNDMSSGLVEMQISIFELIGTIEDDLSKNKLYHTVNEAIIGVLLSRHFNLTSRLMNEYYLTEMVQESLKWLPIDKQDALKNKIRNYLINSFSDLELRYYDEFDPLGNLRMILFFIECINILGDENPIEKHKNELIQALEKGNSTQQARAIVLLALSFGNDEKITNRIIQKIQSPFKLTRKYSLISLFFLKLNNSQIDFLTSSQPKSSAINDFIQALIFGKRLPGSNTEEERLISYLINCKSKTSMEWREGRNDDDAFYLLYLNTFFKGAFQDFGRKMINYNIDKLIDTEITRSQPKSIEGNFEKKNFMLRFLTDEQKEKLSSNLIENLSDKQKSKIIIPYIRDLKIKIGEKDHKPILKLIESDDYNVQNAAMDILVDNKLI